MRKAFFHPYPSSLRARFSGYVELLSNLDNPSYYLLLLNTSLVKKKKVRTEVQNL